MKTDFLSRKADYIGITGSVLCLIHCLITPVLLMTSALIHDEHLRIGYLSLDYVFIGVNIVAVYSATRGHVSPGIKRALWGFLALFSAGILLEDVNEFFEVIGYVASAGLVMTHLINIRQHQQKHDHSRSVRTKSPVADVVEIG
ncbi:MerC domain-containing protein [Spirosoma rigui]|uniref:MerC domain-containing protein n=1 Tax=Spirosoma rigui TaxID=564064 RepID=UPI0009B18FE5|nr:MerC domain-containing protein [Spirosoma rigui]